MRKGLGIVVAAVACLFVVMALVSPGRRHVSVASPRPGLLGPAPLVLPARTPVQAHDDAEAAPRESR